MWFTIALKEINDIPRGTLLKITKCTGHSITVETVSMPKPQKAIMHQPAWWLEDIGFHPDLYRNNNVKKI